MATEFFIAVGVFPVELLNKEVNTITLTLKITTKQRKSSQVLTLRETPKFQWSAL